MGKLTNRTPKAGSGRGKGERESGRRELEPLVEGKLATLLRRPALPIVSVVRRIVVEREGIKLAIQDKGTVDARMQGLT